MTRLKNLHNLKNLNQRIKYFRLCYQHLNDQFGLNDNTKVTDEQIERVFKRLQKKVSVHSMGINYIWNYVTYVFYKRFSHRKGYLIKFDWLVSLQGTNIWLDKEEDWYVYHGAWLRENLLTKPILEEKVNIREREDFIRAQNLNKMKGFVTCIEYTSLVDPNSKICPKCFKKLDCKEILKNNNPKLYNDRYGRTE